MRAIHTTKKDLLLWQTAWGTEGQIYKGNPYPLRNGSWFLALKLYAFSSPLTQRATNHAWQEAGRARLV